MQIKKKIRDTNKKTITTVKFKFIQPKLFTRHKCDNFFFLFVIVFVIFRLFSFLMPLFFTFYIYAMFRYNDNVIKIFHIFNSRYVTFLYTLKRTFTIHLQFPLCYFLFFFFLPTLSLLFRYQLSSDRVKVCILCLRGKSWTNFLGCI